MPKKKNKVMRELLALKLRAKTTHQLTAFGQVVTFYVRKSQLTDKWLACIRIPDCDEIVFSPHINFEDAQARVALICCTWEKLAKTNYDNELVLVALRHTAINEGWTDDDEILGVAYRDGCGNILTVDDSMATRSAVTQEINDEMPGLFIDPKTRSRL